jgi:hypothetical protein
VPPGLHFLLSREPKSKEFRELFRSFLSSKDERTCILQLSEGDARLFIEVIDRVRFPRMSFGAGSVISPLGTKAFRAAQLDNGLRKIAFIVLTELCGRIGYLPKSYLLSDNFDLSSLPRASGAFADVRVGVFNGGEVAIKSLRVYVMDDKVKIRKVGDNTTVSPPRIAHKLCSVSVKRLPCGRTCPTPTFSVSSVSLTPLQREGSQWSPNGWSTVTSCCLSAKIPAITSS